MLYFSHTPGCSLGWHLILATRQCSHAVELRFELRPRRSGFVSIISLTKPVESPDGTRS